MKPTYKTLGNQYPIERDGEWVWSSGTELELEVIEQPDNENGD